MTIAIAGSPGVPSLGLYIRNGEIRQTPIAQNKPPRCVELDAERAARRIAGGEIVQVDARAGNVTRVARRALEFINPSTSSNSSRPKKLAGG